MRGHLDLAQWLVAEAGGSNARSERDTGKYDVRNAVFRVTFCVDSVGAQLVLQSLRIRMPNLKA
jgi:hypothetical protein